MTAFIRNFFAIILGTLLVGHLLLGTSTQGELDPAKQSAQSRRGIHDLDGKVGGSLDDVKRFLGLAVANVGDGDEPETDPPGLARPDVEFKIFQFPADRIPRIDGDSDDWSFVPDSYSIGMDQLRETVAGIGDKHDRANLDVTVKVGWVKGQNQDRKSVG